MDYENVFSVAFNRQRYWQLYETNNVAERNKVYKEKKEKLISDQLQHRQNQKAEALKVILNWKSLRHVLSGKMHVSLTQKLLEKNK